MTHITTASGVQFDPLNPRAEDIRMDDIIAALPRICRFNGHCKWFYSVAQHSCLVYENAVTFPGERWALLHDAAEIYTSDVPAPIKTELGIEAIEQRILDCIAERFDLCSPIPSEVWQCDQRALATEWRDLMPPSRSLSSVTNAMPFSRKIHMASEHQVREGFKAALRIVGLYDGR